MRVTLLSSLLVISLAGCTSTPTPSASPAPTAMPSAAASPSASVTPTTPTAMLGGLTITEIPELGALMSRIESRGIAMGPAGLLVIGTTASRNASVALLARDGLAFEAPSWLPAETFAGGAPIALAGGTAGYVALAWRRDGATLAPALYSSTDGKQWVLGDTPKLSVADASFGFRTGGAWPSLETKAGAIVSDDGVDWRLDDSAIGGLPKQGELLAAARDAAPPPLRDMNSVAINETGAPLVIATLGVGSDGAPCAKGATLGTDGIWLALPECPNPEALEYVEGAARAFGGVVLITRRPDGMVSARLLGGTPPARPAESETAVRTAELTDIPLTARVDPKSLGLGEGTCPTGAPTFASLVADPVRAARCYGDREISFRAQLAYAGECGGLGSVRSPAWLNLHRAYGTYGLAAPGAKRLPGCGLSDLPIAAREEGAPHPTSWDLPFGTNAIDVTVRGHFDDAAAIECRQDAGWWDFFGAGTPRWSTVERPMPAAVQDCRATFVLTGIEER